MKIVDFSLERHICYLSKIPLESGHLESGGAWRQKFRGYYSHLTLKAIPGKLNPSSSTHYTILCFSLLCSRKTHTHIQENMESTLLLAPRFLSIQSREFSTNVRQFQTSFCGKLIANTQFTRRNDAYTNHRSSFKITSFFSIGKKKVKQVKRETVVPDPDYRIPIVLLGLAGGFVYGDNLLAAAPVGLLGLLLLFQTTRVRFVFDDESLVCAMNPLYLIVITVNLVILSIDFCKVCVYLLLKEVKVGQELEESGENVFVGGKNRWKYSSFVNWELWWPNFPILVYFKESQTKPEGQVHFFPVIFNGKQLYDVMVERAGPSETSAPK
ncbi:hypothetical protein SSX86_009913 [Deinandra increscens subsp. villosa]|uniref:DUF3119 domain-containing protein n=1 Tax=Deinandra increscens subsp. villosa TaxID=3103831 RepID=A0AAP0DE69_9ASTR